MGLWGNIKKLVGIKNWNDGGKEQLQEAVKESVTTGEPLQDVVIDQITENLLTPSRKEAIASIDYNLDLLKLQIEATRYTDSLETIARLLKGWQTLKDSLRQ